MVVESPVVAHRDVREIEHPRSGNAVQNFDVDPSDPNFNRDFKAASARPDTARVADLAIHNPESGRATDRAQSPTDRAQLPTDRDQLPTDRAQQPTDSALATPGINFKNLDASKKFASDVREAFGESFNRLNPETQKKIQGLEVITTNHTKKVMRGFPDVPGVTPGPEEKKGNIMVLSEAGTKKQNVKIKDVINHEIFHPIDNATGASHDPELRKAIDLGISRLSPKEQKNIAAHGKEERDNRYAEFAGDVLALEVGSKKADLAYAEKVSNPYDNFKEAREIMRRKYLRPQE